MATSRGLSIGFPRMHKEAGERRDFLPPFVAGLAARCGDVVVEEGIGSRMGLRTAEYTAAPGVRVGTWEEAYSQDIVVVLRAPTERELSWMSPGATLVSMLHYTTRSQRVRLLRSFGLEAISLDLIEDDLGQRQVENCEAVAWNGLDAAFEALERGDPRFADPGRAPLRVTVMGPGTVGRHAVEAATKYGSAARFERMENSRVPGVEATAIGRSLTRDAGYLRSRLVVTDLLVDATNRDDPSRPLIPNAWIDLLPSHAVICDLVVDPYQPDDSPPTVRGIEGIPQGSLDKYVFPPEHPAWEETVPPGVANHARRTVVSCYSWPGIRPRDCMERYGAQLGPLMGTLLDRRGVSGLRWSGSPEERALLRGSLSARAHAARAAVERIPA
jgi:alanine dehydrogenase